MKRLQKHLRNNKGSGALWAVILTLVVLTIACAVYEYARLQIIASGVRDAVQSAIISVANDNYNEVYSGVREGYSGGYELQSSDNWEDWMDTGDVYAKLDELLGLDGSHAKSTGGKVEYSLSDLTVDITNAPFAQPASENRFFGDVTLHLEVPLSFGWEALPKMSMTLKLSAGYRQKF